MQCLRHVFNPASWIEISKSQRWSILIEFVLTLNKITLIYDSEKVLLSIFQRDKGKRQPPHWHTAHWNGAADPISDEWVGQSSTTLYR